MAIYNVHIRVKGIRGLHYSCNFSVKPKIISKKKKNPYLKKLSGGLADGHSGEAPTSENSNSSVISIRCQ